MRERKATKSDDPAVPMSLWEEHLIKDGTRAWMRKDERKNLTAACDTLRKLMLYRWKGKVLSSFRIWLNRKYADELDPIGKRWGPGVRFKNNKYVWNDGQTSKDDYVKRWNARVLTAPEALMAGMDCIEISYKTSWWEWEDGSRPFHWWWPEEYQERIRDGIKVHFRTPPPQYVVLQRDVDPKVKEKVVEKLQQVRMRWYITERYMVSLTSFFAVPKGDNDIRIIYDGSIGGLHDAIWVPWFVLSTLNAHLRAVKQGTYMGDLDVGECFLNFMLHPILRPYSGVDFTLFFPMAGFGVAKDKDGNTSPKQSATVWETWLHVHYASFDE
jgi:hypothetical protein